MNLSGCDPLHLLEPAELPDLLGDQASPAARQPAAAAAAAAQHPRGQRAGRGRHRDLLICPAQGQRGPTSHRPLHDCPPGVNLINNLQA